MNENFAIQLFEGKKVRDHRGTTPCDFVYGDSTLELCRYLAAHSDLGTAASIKKALQRSKF